MENGEETIICILIFGMALAVLGFQFLLRQDTVRNFWLQFARSKGIGACLTLIDYIWGGIMLVNTPLGRFDSWKPAIYLLLPVLCVFTIIWLDELLSARALGALLLLIPTPILRIIRFYPSSWKLLIVIPVYIMIIKGMILVSSPYMLRKSIEFITKNRLIMQMCAVTLLIYAILLIGYGIVKICC